MLWPQYWRGKEDKKNGDGCFAKVWISSLEFPHEVYIEGTCCQIEQQAAREFSPGSHVSSGAVGK